MTDILAALRDLPVLLKAALMGLVEGLTEFVPVSSTGHLILTGTLLGFHDERAKVFDLAIQTGAMMAVIWNYRERFAPLIRAAAWSFVPGCAAALGDAGRLRRWFEDPVWAFQRHLLIAFFPAALLGLLFGSWIKSALFYPVPVAIVLIIGGFVILAVERWVARHPGRVRIHDVDQMSNLDALKMGCAQAFALIPGTSRSGATIIGGMMFGLSRRAATEFSFFLAVPTLMAAGLFDMLRNAHLLRLDDVPVFATGLLVAYASALVVVRWLIRWVSQHSFNAFAVYRIVCGVVVLVLVYRF
jgi:undecaprenyl-diphosphatase